MRFQVLALFFAAVVLSASAQNTASVTPTEEFIEAFTNGLNFSNFSSNLNACLNLDLNLTIVEPVGSIFDSCKNGSIEALEASIEALGAGIVTYFRTCWSSSVTTRQFTSFLKQNIEALDLSVVHQNVLNNLPLINQEYKNIVAGFFNSNSTTLGASFAELVKIAFANQTSLSEVSATRVIRQLGEEEESTPVTALDVILVVKGFLEHANTTIEADDFVALVNNTILLSVQVTELINDLETQNLIALISKGPAAYALAQVVLGNLVVLQNEVVAGLERDLPLVEDLNKLIVALNYINANFNTFANHFGSIVEAIELGDYEDAGNVTGDLYNEIYRLFL